jgi:pectin methylesterase-like acyl-CoA thioesterase
MSIKRLRPVVLPIPFLLIAAHAAAAPQNNEKEFPISAIFPAARSDAVCPDMQLRITFPSHPDLGLGKIQILDTADNSVVESIDVAKRMSTRVIGGFPNFNYYPVLIVGNDAFIWPSKPLAYDKTYAVTIETGAFRDGATPYSGTGTSNSWRFSTRKAPPSAEATKLTVAADGSGDFASIQGAIDFVPDGNATPTTILIRNGTYHELVCFTNKNALTFQGEDRKKTIIAYANNNTFNSNTNGNPFAPGADPSTMPARGGSVYRRGMFLAHRVTDLTITNLTLHNTTPQGGSQAEAIILNGTPNARATLSHLDLYSYQDTLQINGQAYIRDCYIEGDVDFMWGTGPCFFENCQAKSLRSNAYYTQIRNPPTNHGYVFKNCTFEGVPGASGNFLSRIEPTRFPASEVVLIDCAMTSAVGGVAWRLDQPAAPRGRAPATTTMPAAPNVHFWEYNSHTTDGKPVDMSQRLPIARELKLPQDKETIDNYSDPKYVLGGQWAPPAASDK